MFKKHGFRRVRSVPVAVLHGTHGLFGVVHGDDFVCVGLDDDLDFVLKLLEGPHELKNRDRLGSKDVQKIDMLGETIKNTGDTTYKDIFVKYFGLGESTKVFLSKNGCVNDQDQGRPQDEEVELRKSEAKTYHTLAATGMFRVRSHMGFGADVDESVF